MLKFKVICGFWRGGLAVNRKNAGIKKAAPAMPARLLTAD
jgi:hypothetical protein